MANILINKITGVIIELPENMSLGVEGEKLVSSPSIIIEEATDEMIMSIRASHCMYDGENVVLIPEEEWPENIVDEEEL